MTTVAELIAAAAELNTLELKELRFAIQRLEQRRPGERFDLDGISIGLTRLDDGMYLKLRRSSIAIEEDDMFLIRLVHPLFASMAEPQERRWLKLAEARFVLEHLYGESSLIYDDSKGSFAFPCALDVMKAETVFPYLVTIRDHRGWLEFSLRRCVGGERQVDTHLHPPFEDEFSRKEINTFIAYFYGYLLGRLNALLAGGNRPMPSIRRVDSNLILYGYCDGKFFERSYDAPEEFEEAYRRLEADIQGASLPSDES